MKKPSEADKENNIHGWRRTTNEAKDYSNEHTSNYNTKNRLSERNQRTETKT